MAHNTNVLPTFTQVTAALLPLNISISASELHGLMCGYICAGGPYEGEKYLKTLLSSYNVEQSRDEMSCLFELATRSQQQIESGDFTFSMLLPDDNETIVSRAEAFSQWCSGFMDSLSNLGIEEEFLEDEETKEALNHIAEFEHLDYDALSVNEDDEKALFEIGEYTRMAVLRLHNDLQIADNASDAIIH